MNGDITTRRVDKSLCNHCNITVRQEEITGNHSEPERVAKKQQKYFKVGYTAASSADSTLSCELDQGLVTELK